jgi:hypothetical protein
MLLACNFSMSKINWATFLKENLMSDTVNLADLGGQHVELLPARTVLSMFSAVGEGVIPGGGGAGGEASGGGGATEVATGLLQTVTGTGSSTPGNSGEAQPGAGSS